MLVDISNDLNKKIEEVSSLMNLNKEELVGRAVRLYLDDLEKIINLKKEIHVWNTLSDETLTNFESSL
jgi:hypothetical protein